MQAAAAAGAGGGDDEEAAGRVEEAEGEGQDAGPSGQAEDACASATPQRRRSMDSAPRLSAIGTPAAAPVYVAPRRMTRAVLELSGLLRRVIPRGIPHIHLGTH